MSHIPALLAEELSVSVPHVENVIALLDEGNTIPFIARYRKEAHGSMDDTVLRKLEERLQYLRNLAQRKEEVTRSITEQGKMTDELAAAIEKAKTLSEVEDVYRPYKQKRRTRATIAREKGLEPLADLLYAQGQRLPELTVLAERYIDEEKGVLTAEDALAGASDIIAENISDNAAIRAKLREAMTRRGVLTSVAAKEEESVYQNYYDYREGVGRVQNHRVLALNRGEKEGFLKVSAELADEDALAIIRRATLRQGSRATDFVAAAGEDAWHRLIQPSVERETRSTLTDTACAGAIENFSVNLRQLLMQPPVKGHVTMGLDPGYRMGCKVAVVDATGKVLDTTVVYPTFSERKKQEAIEARNQADNLIYATEKSLKDLGDKVDPALKAEVEAKTAELKKAMEGTDTDAIKKASDDLSQASHKLAEMLYKNAQAQQGAQDGGCQGGNCGAKKDDDEEE